MKKEEGISDAVILAILILALLISATALFFLDGGEIKGFETPNKSSELKLHQPVTIDGLTMEVVSEEIEPIYDDTEVIQIEFWQLSPREMIIQVITYPMSHIPLSTGKLLSFIYLATGLAFIVLYRKVSEKNRNSDSRREQIYHYISENPGKSQQQISDAMQIHRSTLKYHLCKLEKSKEIHTNDYGEYPRYFPSNEGLTKEKKIILSLISEEKDYTIFRLLLNHPGLTRKELATKLGLSEAATGWYLTRLKKYSLLIAEKHEKEVQYTLTPDAVTTYRTIVPDVDSRDA